LIHKDRVPTKMKPCLICTQYFYTFGAPGCKGYVCTLEACRSALTCVFVPPAKMKVVLPNQVICYRGACCTFVPTGLYPKGQIQLFCCYSCHMLHSSKGSTFGACRNCNKALTGMPCQRHKQYCGNECWIEYRNKTAFANKTGIFEAILIEYLHGDAKNRYKPSTWRGARANLACFFEFVRNQNVNQLSDIDPTHVTAFIAKERARGLHHDNYLSQISVFFNWLLRKGDRSLRNPVLPDWHIQRQSKPRPRPYSEPEISELWKLLEGNPRLRLAFAIGLESGLRVSEVANIRISDINPTTQQILVRLPTKNMRERVSRFREMTVEALRDWEKERDSRCDHDCLLHNTKLNRFLTSTLCMVFNKHFERVTGRPSTFSFHKLRHTWACTLLNGGIDPLVLMELGGWSSWQSMQFYIQLLQSTIDTSYETAVENHRLHQAEQPETITGLLDFVISQQRDASLHHTSTT
jgi:site-specific recombinase XerD